MNAMTTYILNLIDLVCTLHAINCGATELNPLLQSVPVMALYKIVVVGGLLWWLSTRTERMARYALTDAACLYGAVDIYHIINILSVR